jgi:hypothetical protein
MKKAVAVVFFFLISTVGTWAQCAMCRATLESNVSNGSEQTLSSNLNLGILYLFSAPYLIVAVIAFLWYKNSRPGAKTEGIA